MLLRIGTEPRAKSLIRTEITVYTLVHPLTRYCTVTADNSRGVSRKDSFPNEFIWLTE